MARLKASITTRLVLIAVAILTANPALADKPSWAGGGGKHEKHQQNKPERLADPAAGSGGGKHEKHRKNEHRDDKSHYDGDRPTYVGDSYFFDRHRTLVHNYYFNEYQAGHCPPGLAKKNNGCMPPGQAKKWAIGSPLPRDVIFYDLPPALAINIGPPPLGYRFVRVASDILMIAIGTGIVRDAIADLGGY